MMSNHNLNGTGLDLAVIKSRDKWICSICKKEIKKGSYVIRTSMFHRICLKCSPILFKGIEEFEKDIERNKRKFENNNLIVELKDEEKK